MSQAQKVADALHISPEEAGWIMMCFRQQMRKDNKNVKSVTRKFGLLDPDSALAHRLTIGTRVVQKFKGRLDAMSESSYVIMATEGSFCSNCSEPVDLLTADTMESAKTVKPAFYVCFQCEHVGEVGVGPVNRVCVSEEAALGEAPTISPQGLEPDH